jgi:hypothetical protein
VNLRRRSGVSVRTRDCSDYRLDRIEGAAIADPEKPGPVPAIYSVTLGYYPTLVPQ